MPTGIYKRTKETLRKMSLAHKGRVLSMEHRKKLSLAKIGRKQSEEHIRNRFSIPADKRIFFKQEREKYLSTYQSWQGMKKRCLNPNQPGFKYWGGRGIKVCKRWLDFANFFEDMGEKPKGLTLDRVNNNKNYCKENCHWATNEEQANNKRTNVILRGKNIKRME